MPTAREPKAIPNACYILNVGYRDTPWITITTGRISALSIICDIIVRRVDPSPVRVASGIIVIELVLIGAVACGTVGGVNSVSIGGLVRTDVRCQREWAGREKPLGLINRCLSCEGRGGYFQKDVT